MLPEMHLLIHMCLATVLPSAGEVPWGAGGQLFPFLGNTGFYLAHVLGVTARHWCVWGCFLCLQNAELQQLLEVVLPSGVFPEAAC